MTPERLKEIKGLHKHVETCNWCKNATYSALRFVGKCWDGPFDDDGDYPDHYIGEEGADFIAESPQIVGELIAALEADRTAKAGLLEAAKACASARSSNAVYRAQELAETAIRRAEQSSSQSDSEGGGV